MPEDKADGGPHIAWTIESSRDGESWRSMGTAWAFPDEPLLIHGAGQFIRFRPADQKQWVDPLERTSNECMALVEFNDNRRTDLFPTDKHLGLPVLLPGGETGRLLRFEHADDGYSWTYALEFTGEVPARFRTPG